MSRSETDNTASADTTTTCDRNDAYNDLTLALGRAMGVVGVIYEAAREIDCIGLGSNNFQCALASAYHELETVLEAAQRMEGVGSSEDAQ